MSDSATLIFPAFILAVVLGVLGAWRKTFWVLVLSAVLSLPMAYYLAGSSDFGLLAWLMPLATFGAAYALRQNKPRLVWVLLLPMLGTVVLLILALTAWLTLGA